MHCLSKSTMCFWRMYCACMGGTLLIHRLPSTTVLGRHGTKDHGVAVKPKNCLMNVCQVL